MQELRLVAVSEDGTYLVLATAGRGTRFTLPVDDRLRAAVRGHFSRLGQFEIEVESPLRPKEIQARIRSGETAEEIAESAGIPVERIRWFEGPVLQEREYMAQQAQRVAVRRQGESAPGPPLGELVEARLNRGGVDLEDVEWDSWKCEDSTWRVRLSFFDDGRPHAAEWTFDPRRRHLSPVDEVAARLSAQEWDVSNDWSSDTVTPLVPRRPAMKVVQDSEPRREYIVERGRMVDPRPPLDPADPPPRVVSATPPTPWPAAAGDRTGPPGRGGDPYRGSGVTTREPAAYTAGSGPAESDARPAAPQRPLDVPAVPARDDDVPVDEPSMPEPEAASAEPAPTAPSEQPAAEPAPSSAPTAHAQPRPTPAAATPREPAPAEPAPAATAPDHETADATPVDATPADAEPAVTPADATPPDAEPAAAPAEPEPVAAAPADPAPVVPAPADHGAPADEDRAAAASAEPGPGASAPTEPAPADPVAEPAPTESAPATAATAPEEATVEPTPAEPASPPAEPDQTAEDRPRPPKPRQQRPRREKPRPATPPPTPEPPAEAPAATGDVPVPAQQRTPAARNRRKSKGKRASVPSWDEIMFGARRPD
jgi:DUF3071 family protein